MSVYIDNAAIPYGRMKMCHMIADSTELSRSELSKSLNVNWYNVYTIKMREKPSDVCKVCGHKREDHAPYGPKKPHEKSSLYAKQLAGTINWKMRPETNGPYTLYRTTIETYCDVPLCTACKGFNKSWQIKK